MPSTVVGGQSGGVSLWTSGALWSGPGLGVVGGVMIKVASGPVYVGFSGGLTINSGIVNGLSGPMDGFEVTAADGPVVIPKLLIQSGNRLWATCPTAASGVPRVYWHPV